MVDCIKELLLDGKCVKIDDLAIFGVGIRSKAAETLEEFSLEKNITGMRLKARATGNLSTTNLKLDSQLRQQAEYQKPTTSGGGGFRVRIPAIRLNRTRMMVERLRIRQLNPCLYLLSLLFSVSPSFFEGLANIKLFNLKKSTYEQFIITPLRMEPGSQNYHHCSHRHRRCVRGAKLYVG